MHRHTLPRAYFIKRVVLGATLLQPVFLGDSPSSVIKVKSNA